jgi:hypothetical protein
VAELIIPAGLRSDCRDIKIVVVCASVRVRTSVNAGFSVTAGRNEMKFGPGVCFHGVQRFFFYFCFP